MFYNRKYTTKSITPGKKTLENLPLVELGEFYTKLRAESYQEFLEYKEVVKLKETEDYVSWWNAQNPGKTFSGSLDFLDARIEAKVGDFCGLGSKEAKKLDEYLHEFATKYSLYGKAHEWFFPQMLAKIGSLAIRPNAENKFSPRVLLREFISQDLSLVALYAIAMYEKRSLFLKSMTVPECSEYSSLVPLIMSAFKRYRNISYSEWVRDEIYLITPPKLAEAMLTEPLDISTEDILKWREQALTNKKTGESRQPATTYGLYPSGDSPLYGLNDLYRHMLCQTWCAHPSNRNKYMVLSAVWDQMPEPLVPTEVLNKKFTEVVPW
jgi:hypothetical protein